MAMLMMAIVAPLQILVGHESGVVALEHQPAKIAAMEGWWTSAPDQPTLLFAWPDEEGRNQSFRDRRSRHGLDGVQRTQDERLPGLEAILRQRRSAAGLDHLLGLPHHGGGSGVRWLRSGCGARCCGCLKRLDGARLFHRALVLAAPSGFIAVIAGWIAAEVGRQPWVVYGVMRTADAVSPVGGGPVATSLLVFIVAYAIVFAAARSISSA